MSLRTCGGIIAPAIWLFWQEPPTTNRPRNARGLHLFSLDVLVHFSSFCHHFLSPCSHYEKPFLKQWIEFSPLPDPWSKKDILWLNVDYSSFKLFHLSVLFRASVSSLPTFQEVSLGPHEEKIRKLLVNRNTGEDWQYPVFGCAVVHHKTNAIIKMITQPQKSYFSSLCYGTMYGGIMWWVCIASHRNPEFEKVALSIDGRIPITSIPWNKVGVVQQASQILRTARS